MSSVPNPTARKLILLFDGTNDKVDDDVTNIVKLHNALNLDDPKRQKAYYQTGIGTSVSTRFWTRVGENVAAGLDSAFAIYLQDHVCRGYEWLIQNYEEGDELFFFGFSRGAYTARCLAGMINKMGILSRDKQHEIKKAYRLYTMTSTRGIYWAQKFKEKHSVSPNIAIEFMGCWDTVASVGIIRATHLPFATSNKVVKTFRHALALDERRARFNANLWRRPNDSLVGRAQDPESPTRRRDVRAIIIGLLVWVATSWISVILWFAGKAWDTTGHNLRRFLNEDWDDVLKRVFKDGQADEPYENRADTDVKEVWFAGCHADVGGGSVSNDTEFSLSGPPLRWMIKELMAYSTGLDFNLEALSKLGVQMPSDPEDITDEALVQSPVDEIDFDVASEISLSSTAVNRDEPGTPKKPRKRFSSYDGPVPSTWKTTIQEVFDARSPIYDQLALAPFWWILEVSIMGKNYADAAGHWHSRLGWNLGRHRVVRLVQIGEDASQFEKPKLHYSVKLRREEFRGYKPGAKFVRPDFKEIEGSNSVEYVWDAWD